MSKTRLIVCSITIKRISIDKYSYVYESLRADDFETNRNRI